MTSDWDGQAYGEVAALQRWVADRSIAELRLRGDERVLDVGCGDGRVTARVAALVPGGSVVGVDPSPRMLDEARSRGIPNASFEHGTAESLRFEGEFDVVVSFNALHWVADLDLALSRVRAAVVDGGTAYLQLVCEGERPSVEDVTYAVTRREPYARWLADVPPAYHHALPEEVERAARRGGLELVDGRVDDVAWDFGDAAALRDWLRVGFADWMRPLPDEAMRASLVDDAAADYALIAGAPTVVRFLQLRDRFVAAARG